MIRLNVTTYPVRTRNARLPRIRVRISLIRIGFDKSIVQACAVLSSSFSLRFLEGKLKLELRTLRHNSARHLQENILEVSFSSSESKHANTAAHQIFQQLVDVVSLSI